MTGAGLRRRQLGIGKRALAARIGISVYDLSRIENGSVIPPVATIARMALLLGADARTLFPLHPCACGCGTLVPKERTIAHGHNTTRGTEMRRVWQERRREAGVPESSREKRCEQCGKTYSRRRRENTRKWLKRRCCSAACWRDSAICRTPPHQRS